MYSLRHSFIFCIVIYFFIAFSNVNCGKKKGHLIIIGANTNGQSLIKTGGKKENDIFILSGGGHGHEHNSHSWDHSHLHSMGSFPFAFSYPWNYFK